MSEEPAAEAGPSVPEADEETAAEAPTPENAADASADGVTDRDVWAYLRLAAIGLLSLLALVATVRLYTTASAAIGRWVSPDFVPLFQAAFNLAVLLLALAGLAVLYRNRRS